MVCRVRNLSGSSPSICTAQKIKQTSKKDVCFILVRHKGLSILAPRQRIVQVCRSAPPRTATPLRIRSAEKNGYFSTISSGFTTPCTTPPIILAASTTVEVYHHEVAVVTAYSDR